MGLKFRTVLLTGKNDLFNNCNKVQHNMLLNRYNKELNNNNNNFRRNFSAQLTQMIYFLNLVDLSPFCLF